jgi:hypothetical protein
MAASVAQLAEQLICNQQVAGSTPAASSPGLGHPANDGGDAPPAGGMLFPRRAFDVGMRGFGQPRKPPKGATVKNAFPVGPCSDQETVRFLMSGTVFNNGITHRRDTETDNGRPFVWEDAVSRQHHLQKGSYPSGQRGQTVNLMALPSQVRILHSPVSHFAAEPVPTEWSARFLRP